jgi:hypothetical protein
MHPTTLAPPEKSPRESRIVKTSDVAAPEENKTAPSIEARLWKLAAIETLSVEIETLLLLIVGILGLATFNYGIEQVFSLAVNHSVGK